jgi:hypothetical protein
MSKGPIVLLAVAGLVAAATAAQAPELRRYMKMKQM